jgi:prepilin-type N-terminal cleavage/methylation domain-containing protein
VRVRRLPTKSWRGYSIIEVCIVLVILSLFSTLAILSYGSYRKSLRLKNAAQEISAVLSTARIMAIEQNGYFQASIEISNRRIWVDKVNYLATIVEPKITTPKLLTDLVKITDVTVNSETKNSGVVHILFRPNATSDFATVHLIREADDPSVEENYYTIKVYSSTARSRIYPDARR